MVAMDEKRYTEAEREFTITTNLSTGEPGAEALFNKALIVYRQNRLEEAENLIYELPEKYPSFDYWIAKGFILLADIYIGRDNIFQAEQTLVSVIENYKGEDLKKIAEGKLERLRASQIEVPEEEENDNQ
jgi:TolA-binding protein